MEILHEQELMETGIAETASLEVEMQFLGNEMRQIEEVSSDLLC